MNVYIFQAALLCEDCGQGHMINNERPAHVQFLPDSRDFDEGSYDSDEWPKGPYPHGGGEADSPQHCDACGVFLENALTTDGDTYVRDLAKPYSYPADDGDVASWDEIAARADADGQAALAEWCRYYFAWG